MLGSSERTMPKLHCHGGKSDPPSPAVIVTPPPSEITVRIVISSDRPKSGPCEAFVIFLGLGEDFKNGQEQLLATPSMDAFDTGSRILQEARSTVVVNRPAALLREWS